MRKRQDPWIDSETDDNNGPYSHLRVLSFVELNPPPNMVNQFKMFLSGNFLSSSVVQDSRTNRERLCIIS